MRTTKNCDKALTQIEMNNCAIEKLNTLENNLNKRISKIDKILDKDKKFTVANTKWLSFREAHCESVSSIYTGGSLYNYALIECKAKETQLRLKALENDYKETINIITKGSP